MRGTDDLGVRSDTGGDPLGATTFRTELQLASQRQGELADHFPRSIAAKTGRLRFDALRQTEEEASVGLDHRPDAGPPNLENDRRSVRKPGAMDLGQRRRSQRIGFHSRRGRIRRFAQVLRELRPAFGEQDGRRSILQPAEFANPLRREQIDAGRKDLAELDEGRSQLLHRPAYSGRQLGWCQFLRRTPAERLIGTPQSTRHADPAHHITETVADEDAAHFMQAPQVATSPNRVPKHQPRLSGTAVAGLAQRLRGERSAIPMGGIMSIASASAPIRLCASPAPSSRNARDASVARVPGSSGVFYS